MSLKLHSVLLLLLLGLFILPASAELEDYLFLQGKGLTGSSNGMAFDTQGNLFVANVYANRITVMNPETSEVLRVIGLESGIYWPDDIALAPDGSIYVTEEGPAGGVVRLAPDGSSTRIAELPFSNPIAFSSDGRLFVAQCFAPENGLYEIDPNGVNEPRLVFGGVPGCAINAFDFAPDGFLYAPNPFQGLILRVNVDTGEVTTVLEGMPFPAAVEFDSHGLMYIADQATGTIMTYELASANLETFATLEVGLDNLVFDAQDHLYASSATDGFVMEVLPDGTSRVVCEAGMVAPSGLDVQGNFLFVAEPQAIRQFNRDTGALYRIERSVFSVSEIGSPITIDVSGSQVLLSSWLNNSVRLWDRDKKELLLTMDFSVPTNAIFFGDNAIVTELMTGQVLRINLNSPGERETLASLTVPLGLAASDNDLWVSDWATGMVWQLIADGQTLAEPLMLASGLSSPEGLALTPYGTLIIAETGTDKLLELDLTTGDVYVLAEGLAYDPVPASPPDWFDGVAVAPDGTIYVSGRSANQIYRFPLERIAVTSIDEIVGLRTFELQSVELWAEFRADGTYAVGRLGQEASDEGTFQFEDGQIHYLSSSYSPECGEARYNVFIMKRAGRAVGMSFELVGEDCYSERRMSTDGQIYFNTEG